MAAAPLNLSPTLSQAWYQEACEQAKLIERIDFLFYTLQLQIAEKPECVNRLVTDSNREVNLFPQKQGHAIHNGQSYILAKKGTQYFLAPPSPSLDPENPISKKLPVKLVETKISKDQLSSLLMTYQKIITYCETQLLQLYPKTEEPADLSRISHVRRPQKQHSLYLPVEAILTMARNVHISQTEQQTAQALLRTRAIERIKKMKGYLGKVAKINSIALPALQSSPVADDGKANE